MSPTRVDRGRPAGQILSNYDSLSTRRRDFSITDHPEVATRVQLDAFRKLKPACVSLIGILSQTPTRNSQHTSLIEKLTVIVKSLQPTALDHKLINYLLLPVTQILRHSEPSSLPENFLEATFRLLSHVVTAWRRCEGGMSVQAWEQLWRFTTATVGPIVGGNDKGKGREVAQEVQLEAVRFLAALLDPSSVLRENNAHPTPAMMARCANAKSPLLPTLFQTVTLLLETSAPNPPYLQLQLSSLYLLQTLVMFYLKGQHRVLASVLPGLVSMMAKLIHNEAKGLKGEVAREAANVIKDIVVTTLNDVDLRDSGVLGPIVDDLNQLAEEWKKGAEVPPPEEPPPPPPLPFSYPSTASADPFPPLSSSYLAFTSTQLLAAVSPILSVLSTHVSPLAREGSAALAFGLVTSCRESLPLLVAKSLNTLLLLSRDAFDPVRNDTQRKLRLLLSDTSDHKFDSTLTDLLTNAINALPRLIASQQDGKVEELARLITAIADIVHESRRNAIAELLGPDGNVERWGWALLDCLEFGRPTGWSAAAYGTAKVAERGWEHPWGPAPLPLLIEHGDTSQDSLFPNLPLRHVESEATTRCLCEMLVTLGFAGGEAALYTVEHFILFANKNRQRHVSKAVSAIWVGQKLLDGIASAQMSGIDHKIGRATRKMAREVAKVVVSMDDNDDQGDDEKLCQSDEPPDGLIKVERTSGYNALTTIFDRKSLPDSVAATQTRRLHAQAHCSLLTALSLSTIAVTSRILSVSFRPLLLTSLYTILSHLTSPTAIVTQFAQIALVQVAYHTGYASVQNLILDNVDYVINVVSQRLTYARLSSTAPLVLIAMIRLVGEPIVPLVHDVVDEIFDALDDYHGYERMASSLLAVLVTLIEAMAAEVDANGQSDERLRKKAEFNRIDKPPNEKTDIARFTRWYKEQEAGRKLAMEEIPQRAPQHAWDKDTSLKAENEEDIPKEAPRQVDEKPPTRTQEVCTQILSQCIHFLSHRSPFLRARILSLIARATPVLASGNREGDLLPLIDRAWPLILKRLDDLEPYVVTEAAEVIASLCQNVGDFMSRRVLDHVWPIFRRLFDAQRELDKQSALARRGGVGTQSAFTVSHRLHSAFLRTVIFVAREVPVDEDVLWQIMVLFRPFLDQTAHEKLQALAMDLYTALGRRDGDGLWLVLQATLGTLEGDNGVWNHLRDPRLANGVHVGELLEGL